MADISSSSGSSTNMPKKPLRVAGRIPPQINKYYRGVSRAYRGIAIAMLVTLFLFFLAVTMFFSDYVTYENLRYLAKDFGAMSSSETDGFSPVVYNGSGNMKFEIFKNGLAAAGGDKYLYFDSTGIQMIEEESGCAEPVLVPSEKYLMMYDLGGTGYSIYNQLTRIINRDADNKIYAGDMSDTGAFVLVTRSRETRYVVEVYGSSFSHIMSIYKENYVMDAAISKDGTGVMIVSAVPSDTDFICEVALCLVGESESALTLTYEHTMPLDVYATDDGYVLLCDTGLYFYDTDGTMRTFVSLAGSTLSYSDVNDSSVAVVCSVNAIGMESRVIVLSSSGETLYDDILTGTRVTGVEASQSAEDALVYLKTAEGILRLLPNGEHDTYDAGNTEIVGIVPMKHGAVVCTKTGAFAAFTE